MVKLVMKLYYERRLRRYRTYYDFAHKASDKEREVFIFDTLKKANELQRDLVYSK